MFETLVQDYIRFAIELDRQAFIHQLQVPVLVAVGSRPGQSFQQAKTRMMDESEKAALTKRKARFTHQSPVIELRRESGDRVADEVWLGRSEENAVVIDEEEVSARHALFRRNHHTGGYTLEDLDSTNGTFINQTQLMPGRAVPLKDADVVHFGSLTYLFFYPGGFYDIISGTLDLSS